MGKYGTTEIHPVALALTLAMGIAMLTVRRDHAALPLLIVACFITHAQRIVVGGLDFSMLRLMVIFGAVRVVYRRESGHYRFHPLDAVIPIWLFFGLLSSALGPRGSGAYFVSRLGATMDAAGTYFLFRMLLRDVRDIERTIRAFGVMCLVLVGPMIFENLTGRNLFAFLGGVPTYTNIRGGRFRCQASFSHPLMVGNFAATTAAMVGALWMAYPKQRLMHTACLLAAAGVVGLSNSSGPLMAILTAFITWSLWPLRAYMPIFRYTTFATLFIVHFAREQPVYHLIGRLSSITGGTGWHRVALINAAIRHFDEWWLLGGATTSHWKRAQGSDITNQYILEGLRGGIWGLIAFVSILVVGFSTVGRTLRAVKRRRDWAKSERRTTSLLAWALGACLAAHSMAFIGVSYFGQLSSILYLHLAMIPSLYQAVTRKARVRGPAPRPAPEPEPTPTPRAPTPAGPPDGLPAFLDARPRTDP